MCQASGWLQIALIAHGAAMFPSLGDRFKASYRNFFTGSGLLCSFRNVFHELLPLKLWGSQTLKRAFLRCQNACG